MSICTGPTSDAPTTRIATYSFLIFSRMPCDESTEICRKQLSRRPFGKIQNVEIGSLEQRNEIFNDYLQSGVEVHFFDGKEERDDIVRLLDFDDPREQ